MNDTNFNREMEKQISAFNGEKKKLLLHACCAPCSSACLERLKENFDITVLFYNPNIEDEEYLKRKNEMIRFLKETGWATFLDCDHQTREYYSYIKGTEREKEGGKRCEKCFRLRLEKTASIADSMGFDYFTTTLTISPLKNATLINAIGKELENSAKWLYSDFKKKNGYLRSITLSKEHELYRQNYCGCIYSKIDIENAERM